MNRYQYCIVRCVPDPLTGEFINIAALAGSPETGDWALRQVANESRVRKLAGATELASVHTFLALIGDRVDAQLELAEEGMSLPLDDSWLRQLHHDHRNVVQVTEPAPILADTAEGALDLIFGRLVIDPVTQPRGFVTKHRVLADLREAYRRAEISSDLLKSRVEVFVGDRVHTDIDYAVANGQALQLTQAWSFQKAGIADVATEVKAWGYALGRLRGGETARVITALGRVSTIGPNVDLQVVIASPVTSDQERVYDEAQQVFGDLGVSVHPLGDADAVGVRAAELVDKYVR